METDAFKILKKVQSSSFSEYSERQVLNAEQSNDINNSKKTAIQAQQDSPLISDLKSNQLLKTKQTENINKAQNFLQSQNDTVIKGNYIPSLCISKKEYESIVDKRPLIKFRPVRNSFIKSSDKALLAQSLNVPKSEVDKVINQAINYLLYMDINSIYYNPSQIKEDMYKDEQFKKSMLEKQILNNADTNAQELAYYKEQGDIIGPYVYRHGSKDQLLEYMKYQLSDAKSALKQLYNILDTECRGLYSYFERPIHILDNRTVLKMQNIVKTGLGESKKQGYITNDVYEQNVEWAMQKIYDIQSNTRVREALRYVAQNS